MSEKLSERIALRLNDPDFGLNDKDEAVINEVEVLESKLTKVRNHINNFPRPEKIPIPRTAEGLGLIPEYKYDYDKINQWRDELEKVLDEK